MIIIAEVLLDILLITFSASTFQVSILLSIRIGLRPHFTTQRAVEIIEKDGMMKGLNIEATINLASNISIPVIASGGVGNLDHLVDGIKLGKASAVLAASIFHYGKHSVKEAKDYMDSKGIPVRI